MAEHPISLGFAGLGAMGFGIAANLLKAGYQVNGFDVNPTALTNFANLGGQVSKTAGEASHGQSKYFVMVATPAQVDNVVFGAGGVLEAMAPGAILCLLSTLPPDYVLELRVRLEAHGRTDVKLTDCPVSGGVVGANAGTLTIMLGGSSDDLQAIQPELKAISAPGRLFNCGPLGSASTVKMLNQHLAGIHIVAAAETIAFAKALGLSSREAYSILTNSEGSSWIMRDRGISMLNADWSPKSAVTIFTKDLSIVTGTADSLSLSCPIASVALEAFVERAARGFCRDDDASVICNYENIIGEAVKEPKVKDCLPSPPSEDSSVVREVLIVVEDSNFELAEALKTSQTKTLTSISASSENFDATLAGLPDKSVIALPATGQDNLWNRIKIKNPQLNVAGYHTVWSATSSLQLLFSTESPTIVAVLKESLPQTVKAIHVSGHVGAATSMYLVVRLASLIHLAAAAECFSLAEAKGVSTKLVYELISGAAGSSEQFNQEFPRMQNNHFIRGPEAKSVSFKSVFDDMAILQKALFNAKYPARMFSAACQIYKSVNRTRENPNLSAAAIVDFWKTKNVSS